MKVRPYKRGSLLAFMEHYHFWEKTCFPPILAIALVLYAESLLQGELADPASAQASGQGFKGKARGSQKPRQQC